MTFGFKMIDPLITGKLLEDTGSKELIRYSILFDKKTGETETQLINENGQIMGSGKVDLAKSFNTFPLSFVKKKLEKICPAAEKVMLCMDYQKKVLQIIYLTKSFEILTTKEYA